MTRSLASETVPITRTRSPVTSPWYSSWSTCDRSTLMAAGPPAAMTAPSRPITMTCPAIHSTRPTSTIGMSSAAPTPTHSTDIKPTPTSAIASALLNPRRFDMLGSLDAPTRARRLPFVRNQRRVAQMLGSEPDLQLVRPNDLAHEEVVGAVITRLCRLPRHRPRLLQDDFVGMEQAGDLRGNLLPASRRPRDQRHLGHVVGHGNAHAAKRLDPLRDGVDHPALFIEVLVEEQVELVEGWPADLPVVLLVQIPQGHGVDQQLVEILGADAANRRVERDGNVSHRPVVLELLGVRGVPLGQREVVLSLAHDPSSLRY